MREEEIRRGKERRERRRGEIGKEKREGEEGRREDGRGKYRKKTKTELNKE